MTSQRRLLDAFTLVELLVVIAIISVLLVMLAPMLNKAMEITRRMQCATNLGTIGDAVHVFAGAHGGRAPGVALFAGTSGQQGMGFYGYLSRGGYVGQPIATMGAYRKGTLSCPSFRADDSWTTYGYPRCWLLNINFQGGYHPHPHAHSQSDPTYMQMGGAYGKVVLPPPPEYDLYTLGCVVLDFPRPSWQFMMWESHTYTDYTTWRWGDPETVTLYGASGPSAGYPPWGSCPYAYWAFRHVLPPEVSQYQTQATANVLFIDSHVETINPTARVNRPDRFDFRD